MPDFRARRVALQRGNSQLPCRSSASFIVLKAPTVDDLSVETPICSNAKARQFAAP
jgi:hypothetical protein